MEIIREAYIKQIASALASNRKRIDSLSAKDTSQMTIKMRGNHEANLTWECMHRSMNEERLRFALGDLKIEECREHYEPSGFHKYNGVRRELENIKFL